MKKKFKFLILPIIIVVLIVGIILIAVNSKDVKTISSEKQLLNIYNGSEDSSFKEIATNILGMPFSFLANTYIHIDYSKPRYYEDILEESTNFDSTLILKSDTNNTSSSTKDYSTTNIQVENVDEADITKTDGNYIYSISDSNVIITDVTDPSNIKVISTITSANGIVPEDLILNNNKLVVIFEKSSSSSIYYKNNNDTCVKIYDISNKEKPILEKSYEIYEPYYTSRCINNTLYVISSGNLRKENNKIVRDYLEDNMSKEIALNNIKYLDNVKTKKQTLISSINLNDLSSNVNVDSYLMDISNAYVSENAIYLLNEKYNYNDTPSIASLFGFKGIFGAFEEYDNYDDYGYHTEIYKFNISNNGNIEYNCKTKIKGQTINQYSLDEQNNHLRVALYSNNEGSKVAIFDENLKQIGVSGNIAKGEKMYSSRFIGNKVYMVTYKTMDPLWVIDLSNESNPKVLGELSIPGYSTYLHPYDENHIIGIGMQTEETVHKNSAGKVTSTTSKITGMKMALFDVSDVRNPIQISETIIGDSKTTSSILTNPKALLFSKEKNLIAIPVNNYKEDFELTVSDDNYSSSINAYKNYNKSYIAEGYYVYNINPNDGFKLKGIINHDVTYKSAYGTKSNLLRGLYIDNNLYTISQSEIKVNNLDSLELVSELKIKDN